MISFHIHLKCLIRGNINGKLSSAYAVVYILSDCNPSSDNSRRIYRDVNRRKHNKK